MSRRKGELSTKAFLSLFIYMMSKYAYDQIDPALKPRDVPQEELYDSYDFVIVGGGIAGCVLAARLSEVSKWKIILIEAGGDDNAMSRAPMLYKFLPNTELDWNYTTVPQKRVCLDTKGICPYSRGKVLGGTSVINNMLFIRGNQQALDQATSSPSIPGYDAEEILSYYIKLENATGLNRPRSKNRGYNGPLHVGYPVYYTALREDYVKAGKEYRFKQKDYNEDSQERVIDYTQLTINENVRDHAARAYLYPIKDRENLHIIKYSFVTKILLKGNKALGVEYVRNDEVYTIRARKEVLITAGVFNTPKLLMLSGIGPEEELQKHKIKCIANLPVGTILRDIIGVSIPYEINSSETLTSDVWKTEKVAYDFAKNKKGPLTTNGVEVSAFYKTKYSDTPPTVIFSFISLRWKFDTTQHKKVITTLVTLLRPESNGTVTLRSSDPFDDPVIDPNYLAEKNDYLNLKEGVSILMDIMKSPSMQKYSPKLFTDDQPKCAGLTEKNYKKCILKNYITTHTRGTGTTPQGNDDDPTAVVIPSFFVKGFKNLRAVGSCSRPVDAQGPTYAPTYVDAERVSDIIKRKYSTKEKPTLSPGAIPEAFAGHPMIPELTAAFQQMMGTLISSSHQHSSDKE